MSDCTLCYAPNETPCALSPCAHVFCLDCVHKYDGDRCPLCRVKFERILPLKYGNDADAFQGKEPKVDAVRRRGEMTLGRRKRREERRADGLLPQREDFGTRTLVDALGDIDVRRLVTTMGAAGATGNAFDGMMQAFGRELMAAGANAGDVTLAMDASRDLLGPVLRPLGNELRVGAPVPRQWNDMPSQRITLEEVEAALAEPDAEPQPPRRGWLSTLVDYLWS
jgi:hypothetical protein